MGITYRIDVEAGVIYSVAEGEIGAVDIQNIRNDRAAEPLYHSKLDHLFDGRLATFKFSGEEAQSLANQSKQIRPTAKTAIVIDQESQGFLRMYTAWSGENQQIFHDMASAREWLDLPAKEDS